MLGRYLLRNWRIVLIFMVGIAVRVLPMLHTEYPLGGGGLFYYIIHYIGEQGRLPQEIPYYSCGVPFAYPPLGFIAYAIVFRYTSIPLLAILKWSPVFLSVLSLAAFDRLSKCFVDGISREIALLCFSTMPAIVVHVTASDSIRNLALFLMLISLASLYRALSQDKPKHTPINNSVIAGLCGGLVVLIHPPTALSLSTVMSLFMAYFIYKNRTKRTQVLRFALLALSFVVLSAGIWFSVLYYLHGPDFGLLITRAFRSRPHKSIWFLTMLRMGATQEPFADLWAVTGIVGLVYGLVAGNPLPAFWFLLTPFHWDSQVYHIALSIGAGLGIGKVIMPAIVQKAGRLRQGLWSLFFIAIAGYASLGALTLSIHPDTPIVGRIWGQQGLQSQITDARLEAWAWITDHIPANAQVILMAEEKEWVPAFAHVCANISQGAEWIGKFLQYGEMYNHLMEVSTAEEVFALLHKYRQRADYIYLSPQVSPRFRNNMRGNFNLLKKDLDNQECAQPIFENTEIILYDVRACK